MDETGDELDWAVRSFVYRFVVARERPPSVAEAAAALRIEVDRARAAYERLDRRHALYLQPIGDAIRMAHPFSGVPTSFRVHANDHTYWANCAWDALGIPAALHTDATIDAVLADDGGTATIEVVGDKVYGQGQVVHVLRPFRAWYDDLVFT